MSPTANPEQTQEQFIVHHYKAFERLAGSSNGEKNGQLVALLAFGLYAESECKWAKNIGSPSLDQLTNFHNAASMPHSLEKLHGEAENLLEGFANAVARLQQQNVLDSVVQDTISAVRKTKWSFLLGVSHAVVGAIFYTTFLIAFSILANRFGIDLLEIYKNLAGPQ